ncbi:MAG: hypothetical protein O7J95_21265, partial [Planctomycetota bacterium]|nr:hypothetical protein [Planctomycetota bacterium]
RRDGGAGPDAGRRIPRHAIPHLAPGLWGVSARRGEARSAEARVIVPEGQAAEVRLTLPGDAGGAGGDR